MWTRAWRFIHNAYLSRLQEVLRHDFGAIRYWLGTMSSRR
jgi:hypothetical protein